MADLVTHACVALLFKAGTRGPNVPAFMAGTFLPDLLGRLPRVLLEPVHAHVAPLPPVLLDGWEPLHLPVGMVISAWAVALFFAPGQRRAVLGALIGGMGLHLAVDLLQNHFGAGYLLFFPCSLWPFEIGWIGTEDTVFIVPFLVPLTALIWWRILRKSGGRM